MYDTTPVPLHLCYPDFYSSTWFNSKADADEVMARGLTLEQLKKRLSPENTSKLTEAMLRKLVNTGAVQRRVRVSLPSEKQKRKSGGVTGAYALGAVDDLTFFFQQQAEGFTVEAIVNQLAERRKSNGKATLMAVAARLVSEIQLCDSGAFDLSGERLGSIVDFVKIVDKKLSSTESSKKAAGITKKLLSGLKGCKSPEEATKTLQEFCAKAWSL